MHMIRLTKQTITQRYRNMGSEKRTKPTEASIHHRLTSYTGVEQHSVSNTVDVQGKLRGEPQLIVSVHSFTVICMTIH